MTDAITDYPFAAEPMEFPPALGGPEPPRRVRLAGGQSAWLVTAYDEVKALLTDARFLPWVPGQAAEEATGEGLIFTMAGAEHARVRRIAAKALTRSRVAALRPWTRRVADELVAGARPPMDLVADFGIPLAVSVLGELLGVPAAARERLRGWADDVLGVFVAPDFARMAEAAQRLGAYFAELVEEKRAHPGDDLLTALLAARDGGDGLSEVEVQQLAFAVLMAGYVPPANALAMTVLHLVREPGLADALHRDPGLVPAATEELLRLDQGSVVDQGRVAVADAEVGGVRVAAGEFVLASLRAANRDEGRFADPHRLDVGRAGAGHVSFGHGPHHCLGAGLARMQLAEGIGALVAARPGLRLAVPFDELEWRPMFGTLLAPVAVPVAWPGGT